MYSVCYSWDYYFNDFTCFLSTSLIYLIQRSEYSDVFEFNDLMKFIEVIIVMMKMYITEFNSKE